MDKPKRQKLLRALLQRNDVRNQRDLIDLMWAEGVQYTQATMSRDMNEIGAAKRQGRYVIPDTVVDQRTLQKKLIATLTGALIAADRCGSMVIIAASPGRARMVAVSLRQLNMPEIMGVVGDDECVFVAARGIPQANALCRLLQQCIR